MMNNLLEKIEQDTDKLRQMLPEVFSDWNDLFQAYFHFTAEVGGKIDGQPFPKERVREFHERYHRWTLYDHTFGCPDNCTYCWFTTKYPPDPKKALEQHIALKEKEREIIHKNLPDIIITSMYFGGGTPTILTPELLKRLISGYMKDFKFIENPEISIEAHPNTINEKKLDMIRDTSVNRLSMGIQSLDDNILKGIKRSYDSKKARRSIQDTLKYFS